MPHPASWSLREVQALYFAADGSGTVPVGDVEFRLSSAVVVASAMGLPTTITVPLESDGGFTVELPTTDDPDVSPGGLTWEVHEHIPGGRAKYSITVPAGVGALQLANLAPVIPASVVHLYVRTVNGVAADPETGEVTLPLSATLPTGGTAGQALRKISAANGDAGWSPHWVVDPTTGLMTQTRVYAPQASYAERLAYSAPVLQVTESGVYGGYAGTFSKFRLSGHGNVSATHDLDWGSTAPPTTLSSQSGYAAFQFGAYLTQVSALQSFQSGSGLTQGPGSALFQNGADSTQTGNRNFQSGNQHSQGGNGHFQSGRQNTQSGTYGFQSGRSLNNGGFDYVAMFGQTKTATVARRAYFAMDNGLWIKPFSTDPATPEMGVLGYRSDLDRLRVHDGVEFQSLAQESSTLRVDPVTKRIYGGGTGPIGSKVLEIASVHQGLEQNTKLELTNWSSLRLVFANTFAGEASGAVQSGTSNFMQVYGSVGAPSTQSGYYNMMRGYKHTQSGYYNETHGYFNTQSGSYNTQSGRQLTQSGSSQHGVQFGRLLDNGGFSHAHMFGDTKTATVASRAYFALDNGIWLKPVAGDATTPENGVICYNSTTHKFRGYANGAWVDLH